MNKPSDNGFTPEFLRELSERELVGLLLGLTDPSDANWAKAVRDEIAGRTPLAKENTLRGR